MSEKPVKHKFGEEGSKMEREFERDQGLADKYLAEANAKDLHALYVHRCEQLEQFGGTLTTMAEMYAGKNARGEFNSSPDAIKSMEKVALAAIELAKAVTVKIK